MRRAQWDAREDELMLELSALRAQLRDARALLVEAQLLGPRAVIPVSLHKRLGAFLAVRR